ncbi:homoserine O-acetyltransferase/O-succinyltransferase family protein [Liquorilactobacillus satsumensis]|uniref:Homoserine O-acetyltransferase n=1 Tax=Liquorilactobacillus satsumensis DSM 16230 = JCM 12392 TaxID=1423801 RepID=A0A0R1V003_9LACO|nr:homoserine O-succinyltransferase [Liquorilactobacillus satsumensis]KRL96739.1 homoserine O-succinyltransferase [Liquorilactobacillus satsumensis DSM 16230 = JCM 12392]MCP9312539.1 homoserine O-succinyltransferase [Liquorilactobacillus satsumensis]MCP9328842.1 homoserine O-succinyltransferase [Liquorilactobacillus satsumensis]MCP9360497.1 homoserine O-succinyltransferase [Liquorilactobacillus satsumensis]
MSCVSILSGLTKNDVPVVPGSLKILILNLMPTRQATEKQFTQLLAQIPQNSTVTFCVPETHQFRHPEKNLFEKYVTFAQIQHNHYDALIVTGAAIDQLPFQAIDYWEELKEILTWRHTHVKTSLFVCWGAYAAGNIEHLFTGLQLKHKLNGVYTVNGITMPHSRYFTIPSQNVNKRARVIAGNNELGAVVIHDPITASLYVTGHLEYSTETLAKEYQRDLRLDPTTQIPYNYFDENLCAQNTWRKSAINFYRTWLGKISSTKNQCSASAD